METAADKNLLDRWVRKRDAEAFNALARRYSGLVYAAALRILGNSSDAEDVAQSCFETLAIANNPPAGALAPWLHRVATNRALDLLRTARNRAHRERAFAEGQDTHVEIAWDDIYAHVDAAINELPDPLRIVVLERFYANRSADEIARDLGIHRRTVYHRSERGIEEVRDTLRKRGIPVATTTLAILLQDNLSAAAALPASLSATLGQLAVAGIASTNVAGPLAVAVTTGGILAMKKTLIGIVVIIVAALGLWRFLNPPLPPAAPAPDNYVARSSENTLTGGTKSTLTANGESVSSTTVTVESNIPESASGDITGRFYNSNTGEGVPGLRPKVLEIADGAVTETEVSAEGADSNSEGIYRIANLPPGQYGIEAPRVADYPRSRPGETMVIAVVADSVARNADFALDPGITVSGVVRDADAAPVADAVVVAHSGMTWDAVETKSDAAGAYRLILPGGDGTFQIAARKDGMRSPRLNGVLAEDTRLDITLSEAMASSISGIVIDAQEHRVPRAMVGVAGAGLDPNEHLRSVEANEKGEFRIEGLAAGQYAIYLAPPLSKLRVPDTLQLSAEVLEGEALEGLKLSLGANLSIAGRVLSRTGTALGDVIVMARSRGMHDGYTKRNAEGYATSGVDGAFTIAGLEAGDYSLHALRPGQMNYTGLNAAYPAGSQNVEVVLDGEETVIRGRVVRADSGEAVTQYKLYSMNNEPFPGHEDILYYQPPVHIFHPEGRFELKAPAGNVTVGIIAAGYAPSITNVKVLDSQATAEVTVALNISGRIEGHVVNSQGEGIAGANIFWGSTSNIYGTSQWLARTDSDGRFSTDTVPEYAEVLTAGHPAYPVQEKAIAPKMKFVLEAGGAVSGQVTSDGEPIHDARVSLKQQGQWLSGLGTLTGLDGNYLLKNIPAGEYVLEVMVDTTKLEQPITLAAGETTEVDIEIDLGGVTVRGLISGAEDPERVYLRLDVATASGSQQYKCQGNSDGTYEMSNVVSGTGQLRAEAKRLAAESQKRVLSLEIPGGEDVNFDIHFSSGGAVSGVVAGLSAKRIASVVALGGEHDLSSMATVEDVQAFLPQVEILRVANGDCNPAGEYVIEGLAPGAYTLVAVSAAAGAETDISQWEWSVAVIQIEEDGKAVVQDFSF